MRLWLLCLWLLFYQSLVAQYHVNLDSLFLKKCYIGASFSSSIPVMEYSVSKLGPSTGYALPGYQFRLGIGAEVSKNMGLSMMFFYNSNAFNDKQYSSDLKGSFGAFSGLTFDRVVTNPWKLNGIMIGVFYPIRTTNTTYEFKAMIGLLNSTYPQQDLIFKVDSNQSDFTLRIIETNTNNIAYLAGVDIRHKIVGDWLLKANIDFFYTEQNYSGMTMQAINIPNSFGRPIPDYQQYFQILSAGIGIVYQFNVD